MVDIDKSLPMFAILTLLLAVCAPVQAAAECRFTIIHTNDLHSHDQPLSENGHSIGGMPRIARLIKDLRSKEKNALTIDAGDIFEGTPFFTYYSGAVEVQMLNDAGYQLYTIGNHEFDDGPANLAKQLRKAKFKVLNCNMDTSAYPDLQALIKPSVVKNIAGQKIGFIGAICPDLVNVTYRAEKVRVVNADGDWMSPVRAEVERLRKQGIDKIVLVTHVGVERDKLLAKLPDVDAIIGGHSHTRLEQPIVVGHDDGSSCVVVQTGCYGRAVGKLDLCFQPDGKINVEKTHYKLIDVTGDMPSDKKMSVFLKEKAKPFESLQTEILATATARFDNVWGRADSALGNLVTDAFADGAAQYGATIAMQNRGGLRAAIEAGPISEESVQELLPFANTLMVCTVSGDDLRKILEVSVGGSPEQSVLLGAQFLDVHGLKFEWDAKLEPGHRVKNIWTSQPDGKEELVKPDGRYRVAVNDYTFSIEGFDFSRATDVMKTEKRLSIYLHDYLLKKKTVSPAPEGRIVPL